MGLASVVLGVAALVFMLGGVFLFWVPILGPLLAFGAPVLALAGCVTGGIGMSRARQEGDSTGPATAGLIISIIAFICGLLVAVTCGFCGALCTAATLNPNNRYQRSDGGAFWYGTQWPDAAVAPNLFGPPPGPSGQGGSAPPPAFPPPPMPSGSPDPSVAPPAPSPTPPPPGQPEALPAVTTPNQSIGRRRPVRAQPPPGALPVDQGATPMPQGATRP